MLYKIWSILNKDRIWPCASPCRSQLCVLSLQGHPYLVHFKKAEGQVPRTQSLPLNRPVNPIALEMSLAFCPRTLLLGLCLMILCEKRLFLLSLPLDLSKLFWFPLFYPIVLLPESSQHCPHWKVSELVLAPSWLNYNPFPGEREEEEPFLGFHLMAFYCPPLGFSYHCSSTAGLQFIFPIRYFL